MNNESVFVAFARLLRSFDSEKILYTQAMKKRLNDFLEEWISEGEELRDNIVWGEESADELCEDSLEVYLEFYQNQRRTRMYV